jgi:peptidoglycan/LPS O-acetylase OafA/YrhL
MVYSVLRGKAYKFIAGSEKPAMDVSRKSTSYYVQLDALRAIAVTMVIFSHWAGYHHYIWQDDSPWFNGETGVQLFFIISGFLITGILLDEKQKSEIAHTSLRDLVTTFYIRRFLRIFPAFYATLAISYALGHPDVRQSIWWHVTYLSNFFFALRGEYLGDVSHFWSLAVEEQFYFVWPFLICLIPTSRLKWFICGCIVIAPMFRYCLQFLAHANETTVNVLPFSSLDALSAGALLALIKRQPVSKKYELYTMIVAMGSAIGFVFVKFMLTVPEQYYLQMIFLGRLFLIPSLLGVVILVSNRVSGLIGSLLEWRPLLYIGKISYGIYLFHFFIPGAVISAFAAFNVSVVEKLGIPLFLLLNVFVLLALSSFSWMSFERVINNCKRYFPYKADQPLQKRNFFPVRYFRMMFYKK